MTEDAEGRGPIDQCTPERPYQDADIHTGSAIIRANDPDPDKEGFLIVQVRCKDCGLEWSYSSPYHTFQASSD